MENLGYTALSLFNALNYDFSIGGLSFSLYDVFNVAFIFSIIGLVLKKWLFFELQPR